MSIDLRCYASLAGYQPANAASLPVKPGETIRELLARRGIPEVEVAVFLLNGKSVESTATLADGDRLGLLPPSSAG